MRNVGSRFEVDAETVFAAVLHIKLCQAAPHISRGTTDDVISAGVVTGGAAEYLHADRALFEGAWLFRKGLLERMRAS